MNFLGIIFDFGFTLFEFKEVSLDKYLDCFKIGLIKTLTELKNMNIVVDVNLLERIKKDFNRLRAFYFKDSIKTKEEHNTSSILKEVLENHGITNLKSSFYENLADIYHSFELDEWIPFESTIPTLNNIRKSKNLKLGIISNHPHHKTIELLLQKHDIKKFFDVVITSAQFGKRKPHPDIFLYTINKMGITNPERCLMIGDEYADIMGAHRVGLKTITFNREFKFPFEKEIDLSHEISINDLSELLNYIN